MMKPYLEPAWAGVPIDDYYLEVVKNGTIIDRVDVGKGRGRSYIAFGGLADVVDVLMEHPSISRKHAVIQHKNDRSLYIMDLKSTHGTYINKKRIKPDEYVELHVGDLIQFGSSTRFYFLYGPEELRPPEYESKNTKEVREKIRAREEKLIQQRCDGVTWGMDEDAEDEEEEEDDDDERNDGEGHLPDYLKGRPEFSNSVYSAGIQDSEVDPKDKHILDKIRSLEMKIQHMEEESKRIRVKESSQNDGLTSGQLAALERNDKKISDWKEEAMDLVYQIRSQRSSQENRKRKLQKSSENGGYDDDDMDGMLDMTKDTSGNTVDSTTNWRLKKKLARTGQLIQNSLGLSNQETLSYVDLCQRKEKLLEEIALNQTKLDNATQSLHTRSESSRDNTIDSFVFSHFGPEEEIKLLEHEMAKQRNALESLETLIRITKPTLSTFSVPAPIPSKDSRSSSDRTLGSSDEVEEKHLNMNQDDSKKRNEDNAIKNDKNVDNGVNSSSHASLEHKKKRINPSSMSVSSIFNVEKRREEEVSRQSVKSTNTRDNHSTYDHSSTSSPAAKKSDENSTSDTSASSRYLALPAKDMLEGGDMIWAPPKNQKGDGRTSLNDKYGY